MIVLFAQNDSTFYSKRRYDSVKTEVGFAKNGGWFY